MQKVFVDTAAWIALLNKDDALNQQAKTVMQRLQQEKSVLITSEFVLLEVADAFSEPTVREKTIRFVDQLRQLPQVNIVAVSQELFDAGWQLYCQRKDKDWGLTDCTSFVVMQQENMSIAFTSDKHFEQAGFTRLLKMAE